MFKNILSLISLLSKISKNIVFSTQYRWRVSQSDGFYLAAEH